MSGDTLIVADIGGTNARFAIAGVEGGRVRGLSHEAVLRTADHQGLASAWRTYTEGLSGAPPRRAALAVAGPAGGEVLRFTNNPWVVRVPALRAELGLDEVVLVNDFEAVGHALDHIGPEHLAPVCGPDAPLPETGVISVVGPGTGLGVALVVRRTEGSIVIATEGGHAGFAPADAVDDRLLAHLRARHGRVSAERTASGPGLADIHEVMAELEGRASSPPADADLWRAAIEGSDPLAAAALDRFLLLLGAFAGDVALIQGAAGVALGGGVGLRLAGRLEGSAFARGFTAKGRFEARMAGLPVKLITHPQPGLLGAAGAYLRLRPG